MNYRITFSSYMYALHTVSAHRHFYLFFYLGHLSIRTGCEQKQWPDRY